MRRGKKFSLYSYNILSVYLWWCCLNDFFSQRRNNYLSGCDNALFTTQNKIPPKKREHSNGSEYNQIYMYNIYVHINTIHFPSTIIIYSHSNFPFDDSTDLRGKKGYYTESTEAFQYINFPFFSFTNLWELHIKALGTTIDFVRRMEQGWLEFSEWFPEWHNACLHSGAF